MDKTFGTILLGCPAENTMVAARKPLDMTWRCVTRGIT